MARDTPLGFPAHTLPYRRGEFTTLSTVSSPEGILPPGLLIHAVIYSNSGHGPDQPTGAIYRDHRAIRQSLNSTGGSYDHRLVQR